MLEHPHKICPECQQPNHLNAKTCTRCGREFQTQFEMPQQTQVVMPPPPPYSNYGQPPNPYSNQAPPQVPPPYPGYAQPPYQAPYPYVEQKSKVAAGLFAILFPYLGIHGFYLGNNALGLTVLLISMGCVFLTIITFGIGILITLPVFLLIHLMSLVQGILYLAAPDADFHQKYVVEKRWF